MTSGWPPAEGGDRRDPARYASFAGATRDFRAAERGYQGYARHTLDAGHSGGFRPYALPPGAGYGDGGPGYGHDEAGDGAQAPYHPAAGQYSAVPCDEMPYGEVSGRARYEAGPYAGEPYPGGGYEPAQADAGGPGRRPGYPYGAYEDRGADEDRGAGGYGQLGYANAAGDQGAGYPRYPEDGYGEPGYPEDGAAEGGYGEAGYPGDYAGGGYPGPGYPDAGYPGPGYPDAGYPEGGPAEAGYPDAHHQADYGEAGYRHDGYQQGRPGRPGSRRASLSQQDYGYQDYGDPRYDDPRYGGLAFDDNLPAGPPAASAHEAGAARPDRGYPDAGYGYRAGPDGTGGYDDGHDPAVAAAAGAGLACDADGYGPGPARPDAADAGPDAGTGAYGEDRAPGYMASAYASGQYPPRVFAIGKLSAGMPDPAATGMLQATGMIGATGISDSVELYNYHPGAAGAGQGFLDAPGTIGAPGAAAGPQPPGFLAAPAAAGVALNGAEAGDATGVLEGGSAFFDDIDPAEMTSLGPPPGTGGRDGQTGGTGALLRPRGGNRPAGRRRGRSGDRRLWFAMAGVVVVFAAALTAIFTLAFPSAPGGPVHSLVTPDTLSAFVRRPALEQQMNVGQLRQDVINMSSGQARHVVEAVYEAGDSTSGNTPQIVLFIGGNLLNASPKVSVTSFTQRFRGARITSAGGLGGEAACVNATASQPGSVAMCAWFDNDSFGEVVSPTMNASALASTMRQIRPHVELVAAQQP